MITRDGRQLIDLFCGGGSVFLGHANTSINRCLKDQLEKIWNIGVLKSPARAEACEQIERFFPDRYAFAGLYSTGMEVAEFALRVARTMTGKKGVVGFDRSMHGKSMATSCLGWENKLISLPEFRRLPNIPVIPEDEVLDNLLSALRSDQIGAVFVEPLLGTGGGHTASPGFYRQLSDLCLEYGALLIFDEILTGFYRTGTPFMFNEFGISPDIILFGKAMGNGFPVSGIMLDKKYAVEPTMLPSSTFAGNPMAAVVVSGTLQFMQEMDMPGAVVHIQNTINSALESVEHRGIKLRGKGALWVLDFPPAINAFQVAGAVLEEGVLVSPTQNIIRLLPPATIEDDHLARACEVIEEACMNG
ncbi:MAG: aminotransferase class III-fold pyridoxal phosphate-dependent enzyme [Gammaproteobacteria bacterium]|nr:aminotransferase class III-fold pyridoxal phosphate-dependent enzyme [Gammaproteobacteria bacterium]